MDYLLVVLVALLIGFQIHISASTIMALVLMLLIAATFIGLGLTLGALISDFQGFQLITSFVTFPIFFLSNSIFPLSSLPVFIQYISYINPLTYGIDGLRGTLTGSSSFPLLIDLALMLLSTIIMIFIASYAFSKTEPS